MSECENDIHKRLMNYIVEKLENGSRNIMYSHESKNKASGPAIYIDDPSRDNNTRNGCCISYPDIFIVHDSKINIIEIEKCDEDESGLSPKRILGDIYSVHKSKHYRDDHGDIKKIDGHCRLFILLTKNRPQKGIKCEQYDHIIDSIDFESGSLNAVKIFWKDQRDKMMEELEN